MEEKINLVKNCIMSVDPILAPKEKSIINYIKRLFNEDYDYMKRIKGIKTIITIKGTMFTYIIIYCIYNNHSNKNISFEDMEAIYNKYNKVDDLKLKVCDLINKVNGEIESINKIYS